MSRHFVLSFENSTDRISHTKYYLPKVETQDSNVRTDGRNFFDKPINDDTETYEDIWKITNGQGFDYTTVV